MYSAGPQRGKLTKPKNEDEKYYALSVLLFNPASSTGQVIKRIIYLAARPVI